MKNKKLISIVTPVYNEEEGIKSYYTQITKQIDKLSDKYDFEIIVTDNCSTDDTYKILEELAKNDKRLRIFKFSKNFGYQKSIWTGYSKAKGDVAIEFDCDLQDPPELLPQFLEKWELGYKIVYGIRRSRKEGKFITFLRKLFYRIINKISENDLPVDAGDFILIDRKILDHLVEVDDCDMYLRGIIFSFGYSRIGIEYNRKQRLKGESKFPFKNLLQLALDAVVSQSILPLRIASYLGLVIAFFTILLSLFYVMAKIFFNIYMPAGFTTITVLILFSTSVNAIFLGIIGEYLARIYIQSKKRPITIIEKHN
ncbi:MAG: glycosyltransferase family 2 protein [Pelagibacterales bacterium]|nr:glycosyltransferase family 2 protein [Pelagibacterales bacterium]